MAQSYEDLGHADLARMSRLRGVAIAEAHLKLTPDDARALYMGANGLVALGEAAHAGVELAMAVAIEVVVDQHLFLPWIGPVLADQYIAGTIILAAAPCTAMVFVWSYLTDGDPAYTLVQVSLNDLIMLVLFAPLVSLLVAGASALTARRADRLTRHSVVAVTTGVLAAFTMVPALLAGVPASVVSSGMALKSSRLFR